MKQEKIGRRRSKLVCMTAFTLLFVATRSFAQSVPTTPYEIKTSRGTYSGVLVGGSPFSETPGTVTIDAVLVPLVIQIYRPDGTLATFDPQNADSSCGEKNTVENHFRNSPLVVPSDLTFNGVSVGKVQYIDGFMRAQFWNAPAPGSPNRTSYFNPLKWSFASALGLPAVPSSEGVVNVVPGTNCETGVVSKIFFNAWIKKYALAPLQDAGIVSTTKFVMFITKNVSAASTFTLKAQSGYEGGQHFATGNQTWAWAQIKHTSKSDLDIEAASHEIGEWMNDPFNNNQAPTWGPMGEVKNCAYKFEVGDPLNDVVAPVTLNGYTYHPQELAFFSWFFNPDVMPSFGTAGKFSSNGTFTKPSTACVK